jgi:hypothetical protein
MKKQLSILALALLILVLLVFLFANPFQKSKTPQFKKLFDVNKDEIAAFEINHFVQGLRFEKRNGVWFVKRVATSLGETVKTQDATAPIAEEDQEFQKADLVKVAAVLATLTNLTVGEPVSSETDSTSLFQINDYSLHVILFDVAHKERGRLYVGKQSAEFLSSYVRKNKEKAIYLVDENLAGLLLYPFEEWRKDEKSDGKIQN